MTLTMAERTRALDWAGTPLGPAAGWSERLATVVELMLASPQIATLAVGPERVLLYNDHAAALYGDRHPGALGRQLPESFAAEFAAVAPIYDRVFAGESVHVPAQPLTVDGGTQAEVFDAYLTPVRDREGQVIAAMMTGFAIGRRLADERRLQASAERQAFLLRLSDALRPLGHPGTIEAVACRLLGEQIGATRAYYVGIDEAAGTAIVLHDHRAAGLASLAGAHPIGNYGWFLPDLRAGRPVRVDDAATVAAIGAPELARLQAAGLAAFANVPLNKDGVLVGVLCVTQATPRAWSDDEMRLVGDVAERIWAAVERAGAERALRDSEALLAVVFDSLPVGACIIDGDGRVRRSNARMHRFLPTGVMPSRDPTRAGRWRAVDADGMSIPPEDFPGARALRGERGPGLDMCFTDDDGREIWTNVTSSPLHGAGGTVTGQVTVVSDIDALKRAQEGQQLLVAELQHRVRNILAVVRSVFGRTLDTATDLEQLADHFLGRLDSLARTQVVVTGRPNGTADLENLIRDELLSAAVHEGTQLSIEGPDVALSSKEAESIAMAIHELTTNALKFGALKYDGGIIKVRWEVNPGDRVGSRLDLYWTEQGVPAVSLQPARRGFGTELITEALPYRLGAETELTFRGGGVRCAISLPLTG